MLERNLTVGEVVARLPQSARFFSEKGIDFCCGGNRPLVDALQEKKLDVEAAFSQLEQLAQSHRPAEHELDFTAMSPAALCEHIVETHHAYLWRTLPQIERLTDAVMRAHGVQHPELFRVGKLFGILRGDLGQHLLHEELVLFPSLLEGHDDKVAAALTPEIIGEHEQAGSILEQLRGLTQNYTVPDDGCPSYTLLYQLLPELEQDLHQHVHLENNILLKAYDVR